MFETDKRLNTVLLPAVLCFVAWADSLLVGSTFDFGQYVHGIGLAVHVISFAVAFGTIMVVDWLGILWLLGKVPVHEPGKLESAAKPLIWGGLAGLLFSGAFIRPDLDNPLTWIKLVCVLILMLNGLFVHPALQELSALPQGTRIMDLGRLLRVRLMVAAGISQACWWTALLIGLMNSTLRRWPT